MARFITTMEILGSSWYPRPGPHYFVGRRLAQSAGRLAFCRPCLATAVSTTASRISARVHWGLLHVASRPIRNNYLHEAAETIFLCLVLRARSTSRIGFTAPVDPLDTTWYMSPWRQYSCCVDRFVRTMGRLESIWRTRLDQNVFFGVRVAQSAM